MLNVNNLGLQTLAYEKGQSGNPLGLKARKPIRDALLLLLSRDPSLALDDVPKTIAQRLAMDMIKDAMEGVDRMKARAEVVDRTEGKPAQAIVGDTDLDPIQHSLVVKFFDKPRNNDPGSV